MKYLSWLTVIELWILNRILGGSFKGCSTDLSAHACTCTGAQHVDPAVQCVMYPYVNVTHGNVNGFLLNICHLNENNIRIEQEAE